MKRFVSSIDLWYALNIYNQSPEWSRAALRRRMFRSLYMEIPSIIEVTFERTCNLACQHCVFQSEPSSRELSREYSLGEVLLNVLRQIPKRKNNVLGDRSTLIDGGRTLI